MQIVITEKTSQAKDVRAAVGGRYGTVLAAEGHLLDLQEPEDAVPAWKRWTPVLLRPDGLYGLRPATGGNKAAKLAAIREALRGAKRVWLATDCDREGQLIGQEILEHLRFRGEVMRVMFTAQDPETIRAAFSAAKPNGAYARLYAAAVARRQADQIYNLSLTRTATVTLAGGSRTVIGVGRVKTPTLAIVCRRELEIRQFVPEAYYEVVATATAAAGPFRMRHAPKERITKRAVAEAIAAAANGFTGPLAVSVEDKRQSPPRLHDLPSLQKLCGSRFGWSAAKTLEIAQELYDGAGKKVITYPRAETRYLPESLIADVPRIVAGLRAGRSYAAVPVPDPPVIRRGSGGTFSDRGLAGASHHAVIPNANTMENLAEVWPRLSADERRLFDVVARAYLAALMPDYRYRQTVVTSGVPMAVAVPMPVPLAKSEHVFRATGRQPIEAGWRAAFPDWQPAEERGEDAQALPTLRNGEPATLSDPAVEDKETRPPPRYNEGTLIDAMQNAWRFIEDPALRDRLKEAKGIGTPATRAEILRGLKAQDLLTADGKLIVPTERGLALHGVLERADPALVDPGVTARMEQLLDDVLVGQAEMLGAIDAVCEGATRIIGRLVEGAASGTAPLPASVAQAGGRFGAKSGGISSGDAGAPTPAMKRFVDSLAQQKGIKPPRGYTKSRAACRAFLDQHAPQRPAANAAGADSGPTASADRPAIAADASPAPKSGPKSGPESGRGRSAKRSAPTKAGRAGTSKKSDATTGVDTPLRIPFGNKEAAQQLGARYRAGSWYAPTGVDLHPFRDRGWL